MQTIESLHHLTKGINFFQFSIGLAIIIALIILFFRIWGNK